MVIKLPRSSVESTPVAVTPRRLPGPQLLELSKLAVPRTDLFSGLNLYTGQ